MDVLERTKLKHVKLLSDYIIKTDPKMLSCENPTSEKKPTKQNYLPGNQG